MRIPSDRLLPVLSLSLVFLVPEWTRIDPGTELKQVAANLGSSSDYEAEIQIHVEAEAPILLPKTRMIGVIARSGERYFSEFEHLTLVYNKRCMVVVDHRNKLIKYGEPDHEALVSSWPAPADSEEALDAALAEADSVVDMGPSRWGRHLSVKTQGSMIERTDIFLDREHRFRRIEYQYAESEKDRSSAHVTIDYLWRDGRPDEALFSEERFVIRDGEELVPSPDYGTYRLERVDET